MADVDTAVASHRWCVPGFAETLRQSFGHRSDCRPGSFAGSFSQGICYDLGTRSPNPDTQLHLDANCRGRPGVRGGPQCSDRIDGGHGFLHWAVDLYLFGELHEPRQKDGPVFLLLVYFHGRDAGVGGGQQPAPILHVLGNRRIGILPLNRILVPKTLGSCGRQKSVHHHPHWGPGFPHRIALGL